MPSATRLLATLSLLLVLAGCAGQLPRWGGGPEPDPQAESLFRAGDYEGAMHRYRHLAQTTRDHDYYLLRAADAALRAGDGRTAQQLADAVDPRELEKFDRNQYLLLQSRLDLNAGRARDAMAKLNILAGERLEGGQEVHYRTLRASAYNQLGDMLASARERVELGRLLSDPEAIRKNNEAIYDALDRLPDQALTERLAPESDTLSGWMDLTHVLKTTPPGGLSTALNEWRTRYPGHPADGGFLDSLVREKGLKVQVSPLGQAAEAPPASQPPAAPAHPFIGVLLPLSGPYAAASQAIRSGMLAAYYADPNPAKLPLRFVDSQAGDVYQSYRKLAEEGASAVVGPLTKEHVVALSRGGDLPVPVLALNQTAEADHEQLFQLGLTPEQDVEQAAGSAWFDARQNALVLAPATQFGQRMIKHFTGYWRTLGGKVLAVKTYPHHGPDLAAPVQELLAKAAPPPAGAAPNAAQPADFVFLIADARDARSIMPQIATHAAGRLPVYGNSHVYSGKSDPAADQDLDGLIFCDLPWLLNPNDGGPLSTQALATQIQQTPPDYVKLIALGLDAYRLVPQLRQFKDDPQYRFSGATGTLSLQTGNRFQRQLECAQFAGGTLQPRGTAPVLQSPTPPVTAR